MKNPLSISLVSMTISLALMAGTAEAGKHRHKSSPASRESVKEMIASEASSHGVPKSFALRIAKVESGFNPSATGAEGEIGVFQLKCATARGIGYEGSCKGLYDAATNVEWGLRYLGMAVKASGGNLRLAASMHNGGLGTRHIIKEYVKLIF